MRGRLDISWLVAAIATVLCGCSSGGSSSGPRPAQARDPAAPAERGAVPRGPAIKVEWEALARERELLEASRFRRAGIGTVEPRIVLLSESHPDSAKVRAAKTPAERERYAGSAVLPDAELEEFVRGLEARGFFRLARSTGSQAALFGSDAARGRVTVERDGGSWSVVSMRGQGQNPATRDVPRLYSEAKQAIMVVRNRTTMLNVSSVRREKVHTGSP